MRASHLLTFNLHGLGEPPRFVAPDEIQFWLPSDFFVEILERVAHLPQVHLTFDDGNESDFEVALPELTKRGVRAQFFLLAGRIGQPGYLDAAQIREMISAGMGIGLHGMNHRSWAHCDSKELEVEIDEARRQIESIVGRPVIRAACPFGAYNAPCLRKLRKSGFERVYTSDGGVTRPRDWLQARNTLRNSYRLSDIQTLAERPPVGLRHVSRRLRTFVKSKRLGASS